MQLQTMTILGGVGAILATILIDVRVRLHMRVEHRLVDATIVTLATTKRLRAKVIAKMILQVVLVLGDKVALWTRQHLVRLDVQAGVLPKVALLDRHVAALFAAILAIARRIRPSATGCQLVVAQIGRIDVAVQQLFGQYSIARPRLRRRLRMKVANVSLKTALGARGVIAMRTAMVEMSVHVIVELLLMVARIAAQMTSIHWILRFGHHR